MLQRDGYPAGVPCFVDTAQPDPQAATEFYGGLFGWEFEDRMPADVAGHFFSATLDGATVAAIASQQPGDPPAPSWATYIAVDSADATAAAVREAGGSVLMEPFDVFSAGRMAMCADPQGAVFSLWQANEHKGAQVVNAPGSWNWSDLQTSDVDSWLMETRREDAPPHWAVTFAVDGTDAAAERAAELGGTVVVAPFDAGPTRVAVLRDPQGAIFSISTYVPTSQA